MKTISNSCLPICQHKNSSKEIPLIEKVKVARWRELLAEQNCQSFEINRDELEVLLQAYAIQEREVRFVLFYSSPRTFKLLGRYETLELAKANASDHPERFSGWSETETDVHQNVSLMDGVWYIIFRTEHK